MNERGTRPLCHGQPEREHRNLTHVLRSNAFFNPSFSALAQWDEDPFDTRFMFSFIRAIILGFFKFEIRSSHCVSMMSSWLNEGVRTLTTRVARTIEELT